MSSKSTLSLERLPPEVLSMIVAPLLASQLDGISRASKRIRDVVQQHVFKSVNFSGVQDKVLAILREFVQDSGASNMDGIRRSIRHATIRLPRQLYYWEEPNYSGMQGLKDIHAIEALQSRNRCDLPREIVKVVGMMSRLSVISLDLWHLSRMQKEDFRNYLGASEKWSTVEDLGIDAESTVYEAVFSQYVPEKLTSLRLQQRNVFSLQYAAARRHFPRLKRLQLGFLRIGFNESLLLQNFTIDRVSRDFPELEWLVVTEKMMPEAPYHHSWYKSIWPEEMERSLTALEATLKKMPCLCRLAVTLRRERVMRSVIAQQLQTRRRRRAVGDVVDEWYSSVIRRIAKAVPRLEQLVIISMHDVFYRGARVGDRINVTKEGLTKVGDLVFPKGLVG